MGKAMRITLRDIVLAHGPALLKAHRELRNKLKKMDRKAVPLDLGDQIRQLNDSEISIHLTQIMPKSNIGATIWSLDQSIKDIRRAIAGIRMNGPWKSEAWVLHECWKLELAERGEDEIVTMGMSKFALRMIALYEKERERQGHAGKGLIIRPQGAWCSNVRKLDQIAERAQRFFDDIHLASDSPTERIESHDEAEGHAIEIMVEPVPGQINVTAEIMFGRDGELIGYIGDNSISLETTIPEAVCHTAIGKPIEEIFDHELVRGLGLKIKKIENEQSPAGTWSHIDLKNVRYKPIKMRRKDTR